MEVMIQMADKGLGFKIHISMCMVSPFDEEYGFVSVTSVFSCDFWKSACGTFLNLEHVFYNPFHGLEEEEGVQRLFLNF